MKIIVGLGNPGKEYENTRHNVGFKILDKFSIFNSPACSCLRQQPMAGRQFSIKSKFSNFKEEKKFGAELAKGEINGEKVIFVKPQTFMNKSGGAVSAIMNFYKIDISDLIVIHDDSDLDLGRIKIQKGGGSAGHHGIESIIKSLGGDDFIRIKVGVRTEESRKAGDFILMGFDDSEKKTLEEVIAIAVEAVDCILKDRTEKAMNRYNVTS